MLTVMAATDADYPTSAPAAVSVSKSRAHGVADIPGKGGGDAPLVEVNGLAADGKMPYSTGTCPSILPRAMGNLDHSLLAASMRTQPV